MLLQVDVPRGHCLLEGEEEDGGMFVHVGVGRW